MKGSLREGEYLSYCATRRTAAGREELLLQPRNSLGTSGPEIIKLNGESGQSGGEERMHSSTDQGGKGGRGIARFGIRGRAQILVSDRKKKRASEKAQFG